MVSKEDIFKFSPCAAATHELVDRCFGNREFLTARDVLDLVLEGNLEKIRADFIGLIDQQWLKNLSVSCPVYDIIGKVARCFDRSYPETYAVLIRIVESYA